MKKSLNLLLICAACVMLSSCVVGKKKYDLAENGRWAALLKCDSLSKELAASKALRQQLEGDTTLLGKNLRNYKSLLNGSQNENKKLNDELARRQKELDLSQNKLNTSQKELLEREKRILEMQDIINKQNEKVQALLDNVKNALMGFSDDELSVREEGGKIYVAMSDKLLFESGKAEVNLQGQNALGKLAEVLKRQTDIDVVIEGHTDNVPIKTAVFKDNWDLSVIRATSVTRLLIEKYGVNPLQIQPSGRGEYKPIAENVSADGRAKNRRTEIIITPKLDTLFEMLRQN